jgi:predicted CoA-binding protein
MSSSRATIAIVGASTDRNKFGNKAVRAFVQQGYTVIPVNPREAQIEGLTAYKHLNDIPGQVDEVSFYIPAPAVPDLIPAAAAKGAKKIWLNPGTESDAAVQKAESLGIQPIVSCSILAVGKNPNDL